MLAALGPYFVALLGFLGSMLTFIYQNRKLRQENEALKASQDSEESRQSNQDVLQFVTSLQTQVKTNYDAFVKSEESRKALYDDYLALQDQYSAYRAKQMGIEKK